MKKATTTRIINQVCSLRKAKTWLAALKMKLNEAWLMFDIIEFLVDNLGAFFYSQGNHAQNDADSHKNSLKGPAVLLEDVFNPLEQGSFPFPHLNLCVNPIQLSFIF